MMLVAFHRLIGRRGRSLLVAAVAVGAAGLSTTPALAASPAKWAVAVEHHNAYGIAGGFNAFTEKEGEKGETFARESGWNTYTITITNTGETASAGPVTVLDNLPVGIGLAGPFESKVASGPGWSCKVLNGAVAAECSTSTSAAPGATLGTITLHAHVSSQAADQAKNLVTVSGGGAESPSKAEDVATITPEVPFGVHCFAVSILEELQPAKFPCEETKEEANSGPIPAGGHPFSQGAEIVLNSTPSDAPVANGAQDKIAPAGGAVKELEVELPPGFVGDPQNLPQCPLQELRGENGGSRCPENTAVGFITLTLETHIESEGAFKGKAKPFPGGKSNILVYNMQADPGHPAEFGFVVQQYVPFLIEATVRSNGDFGVNVGDLATGEKPLGIRTTFCEYGAHIGKSEPDEEKGLAGCNKPTEKMASKRIPPGSKPFLTNPTQCTGTAPAWTVWGIPWDDLTNLESTTDAPNTVVGCESLQFHPELEFKPSAPSEGGTSEADEPTGVTVNLRVPQTNEAAAKATPEVKNVVMTLPAGMTGSPSAADGLQACSNAQFGLGTEFGPGAPKTLPEAPPNEASCPKASQIGTVEVFTPLLSGAPTIEGELQPKCLPGDWANSPTEYAYQWLRNGVPIAGATSSDYVPIKNLTNTGADQGKALQCQVTATNTGGSSVAVSRSTVVPIEPSPLPPIPPASVAAPSGNASTGSPLTCESGAWTGATGGFAYAWLRGGAPIAGAESAQYTLTSEDEGKVIQCQVTGKSATGEAIADSAAVVPSPLSSPPPPLPGAALQGQVFLGEPECSPCTNADAEDGKMLRLFLQIQDQHAGLLLKLHGTTSANAVTGQLTTTFVQQPQQPFELLQLKLNGGPRATLATPQSCGPATTSADLTPWSEPFTPVAHITSSFNVGGCASSTPFSPAFNAGTTGANATAAGTSPTFSLTFSRQDREQDLSGLQVRMPLGLVGKIAGVTLCGEAEVHAAEANDGECPAASKVGTADAGAGPGPDPFFTEGNVYLTGAYKGAPFGLAVVTHAIAGPFNLGNVVVRSTINIDPHTAAVTATSDPLPQIVDGVPLRLRTVNVKINRSGFMVNPTNCNEQHVSATLTGSQGTGAQVSSPFGLGGCTALPFKPTFTATTEGHTSKVDGASLDVKITYPPGAYANIAKSVTELPNALPSRLTTIQKACVDTVFEANPAACDEGSVIGHAIAHTPLLANPLTGPAYLVSHGNRAFPDIEIVLQGEGITVDLDGLTDIKKGVTKTTFESLPDSPISTFELMLPEGPHSALAANVNLCEQTAVNLPTILTGQNGAVEKQETKIAVTGCPPTVSISKAKLTAGALLVTVRTTALGAVKIDGKGLKTTIKRNLKPGTYQIRVPFTKIGKSLRKHRRKTSVHVSLTAGRQAVAKATTVRL